MSQSNHSFPGVNEGDMGESLEFDEAGEDRCGRCGCKRKEHSVEGGCACGKCKRFSEMKKRKR